MFDKSIVKCCDYCLHASDFMEGRLLCDIKGPVDPEGKCPKYIYDPIRRIPPEDHIKAKAVDPASLELE